MLKQIISGLLFALVLYGASLVFQIERISEQERREMSRLRHEILRERVRISELKLAIISLKHPARIQRLAHRHAAQLSLGPVRPGQIYNVERLKELPPLPEIILGQAEPQTRTR